MESRETEREGAVAEMIDTRSEVQRRGPRPGLSALAQCCQNDAAERVGPMEHRGEAAHDGQPAGGGQGQNGEIGAIVPPEGDRHAVDQDRHPSRFHPS